MNSPEFQSTGYITLYQSSNAKLTFKRSNSQIIAEGVFNQKQVYYPLNSFFTATPGLPSHLRSLPEQAVMWLLSHQYVPSVENDKVIFLQTAKSPYELKSEEEYARALEEAEKTRDYLTIVRTLESFGQICFLEKKWKRACKFFNSALAINRVYSQEQPLEDFLFHCLAKVENAFTGEFLDGAHLQSRVNMIQSYRKQLRLQREQLTFILNSSRDTPGKKEAIHSKTLPSTVDMKQTLRDITCSRQELTVSLIQDCFSQIGHPPCRYAFISLGSMSRQEMSPFSDLEFAILIDSDLEANRRYFRRVAHLLELKVINLGETFFPILKKGLESPMPSGFCFDSGGNTPLGKEGQFELIGSPSKLAQYVSTNRFMEDQIVSNAMSNVALIQGDEELVKNYEGLVNSILDLPFNQLKVREHRALLLMKGDVLEFAPQLDQNKEDLRVFDIKKELYRLPNSILHGLSLFYGLKAKNSWDRLEELFHLGLLSQEGVQCFTWIMNVISQFRVKAHLHYCAENEKIFYEPESKQEERSWLSNNYYILTKKEKKLITKIFQVLLPIHEVAKDFIASQGKTNAFWKNSLLSEFPQVKDLDEGYQKAKESNTKALALDPFNPYNLGLQGVILNQLADYGTSVDYYTKALQRLDEILNIHYLPNEDTVKIVGLEPELDQKLLVCYITMIIQLASALANQGKPQEALTKLKIALELHSQYLKEEKSELLAQIYGVISLSLITIGHFSQALEHLELAQSIYLQLKNTQESIYSQLGSIACNKGCIYKELGQYEMAINCLRESIDLTSDPIIWGIRKEHLGITLFSYGQQEEGIRLLKEAYQHRVGVFGEIHPDVAITLSHLGGFYQQMELYKEAIGYFKQELHINQQLKGISDSSNITRWQNLGDIARLGRLYPEAKGYYQSKLKLQISCLGQRDASLSLTYAAIGRIEELQGNYPAAVESITNALTIYHNAVREENDIYIELLTMLGTVWQHTDPKRALAIFTECLPLRKVFYGALHPEVGLGMMKLGSVHKKMNQKQKAITAYQEAYALLTQTLGPSHTLTKKCFKSLKNLQPKAREETDQQEKEYENMLSVMLDLAFTSFPEKAASRTTFEARSWMRKAEVDRSIGSLPSAISALEKAIQLDPTQAESYKLLASIFEEMRLYEKAFEAWKSLFALYPEDPDAQSNVERLCILLGQPQKAAALLEGRNPPLIQSGEKKPSIHSQEINQFHDLKAGVIGLKKPLPSEDLFSELACAIEENRTSFIQERYPFDINLSDPTGNTLLHYAVFYGNDQIVRFLCEKGADLNLTNKDGVPPIFKATAKNRIELFRYLLAQGARIDHQSLKTGSTLLHSCVSEGNFLATEHLLSTSYFSVDVETEGNKFTPLFIACQNGDKNLSQLLIQRGAQVNHSNALGCTPLMMATHKDHHEVVSLLLRG